VNQNNKEVTASREVRLNKRERLQRLLLHPMGVSGTK